MCCGETFHLTLTLIQSLDYLCIRLIVWFVCYSTVMGGKTRECQVERRSTLTADSGYLASITSTVQGFGTSACPWVIKAAPGQQINVTMYNFISSHGEGGRDKGPDVCYELAVLKDGTSRRGLTACSSEPRQRVGHVSQTNELTVEFLVKPSHGRLQFLLHYQGKSSLCYILSVWRSFSASPLLPLWLNTKANR